MQSANLTVRFLLELCALAAFAYWGFHAGRGLPSRLVLAVGAPLLMAVAWGVFVSPRAPLRLSDPARLALEVVIFGLAGAALTAAGRPMLALVLVVAAAVNLALMYLWGQRGL